MNGHGVKQWQRADLEQDSLSRYVCYESLHHVRSGWSLDLLGDSVAIESWLGDIPQDAVVYAAAVNLGWKTMLRLAKMAESKEDWWSAAKRYVLAAMVAQGEGVELDEFLPGCKTVRTHAMELLRMAMTNLDRMEQQPVDALTRMQKDAFELELLSSIFGDKLPADVSAYSAHSRRLMRTHAALVNPVDAAMVLSCVEVFPTFFTGDTDMMQTKMLNFFAMLQKGYENDPDVTMREKCLISLVSWCGFFNSVVLRKNLELVRQLFGDRGQQIHQFWHIYFQRPAAWSAFWAQKEGYDPSLTFGCGQLTMCLADQLGDVEGTKAHLRKIFGHIRKIRHEQDPAQEYTLLFCDLMYPLYIGHAFGPRMAAEYIDCQGIEYEDFESRWKTFRHSTIRPHGDVTTMNRQFACSDGITKASKMASILAERGPGHAAGAEPSTEELLQSIPSLDECVKMHHTIDNVNFLGGIITGLASGVVMKAFILERLGAQEYAAEALKHLDVILSSSDLVTGTVDSYGHAAALACRGRLLKAAAADGDINARTQAVVAFEAALQRAEESGRWLLALSILGDMQRAGVPSRQGAITEIMEKLVSPPKTLRQFVDVERIYWPPGDG
eukprot:SAG31_NODE_1504_length_8079_cov_2.892607_2_plen_611_part_00